MSSGSVRLPEMDGAAEEIRNHLLASAQVKHLTADSCLQEILAGAALVLESLRKGGKVMICGNGGSAADAQHLAGEFVNLLHRDRQRPAMAAIALTTDTSVLTAVGNDCGFASIFERQVAALGKPEDVIIAISTSGNSENVIRAVRQAKQLRLKAISLTGAGGGRLKPMADVNICVPSQNTQQIQEAHLAIEHILCKLVERQLFGKS